MLKYFEHDEGITMLVRLAINNALVPIIGSGFTMGSVATNGNVPNGEKLRNLMQECILQSDKEFSSADLSEMDFNETADIFLNEKYVTKRKRLEILSDYFTNVKLDKHKIDFLNTYWKYVYTINVDDGIENNTNFYKILPYSNLNDDFTKNAKNKRFLYKIHGDANHEITTNTEDNIVFSEHQYISSMTKDENRVLRNTIYSDYKQRNIVFVGCSLSNEIDIKQIYNNTKNDSGDSYRICVKKEQSSTNDIRNLKKHGINVIIRVKDYDLFYRDFVKAYNEENAKKKTNEFEFINPKIETITSIDGIVKYSTGYPIFNTENNIFKKPITTIQRTLLRLLQNRLEKATCVVIKGRRFSGKTTLLCLLRENTPRYTTYFFPSSTSYDEYVITRMIADKKNSLFIFDSNSMISDVYLAIAHSKKILDDNLSKIVVASNTNDDYLIDNLDAELIELNYKFDDKELRLFNEEANKKAFIQKKRNETNLDYALNLLEQQRSTHKLPLEINPDTLSLNDKVIFVLLSSEDKIFYRTVIALDIPLYDIRNLKERYAILLEEIKTSKDEFSGKSSYKLVHNSKAILINTLRSFSDSDIVSAIHFIVSKFNKDRTLRQECKNIILFDTLNQIFKKKDGAGYLINKIYDRLESVLYNDMHFWLQRAKSIYRLFKNDKNQLLRAKTFADKVFKDTIKYSSLNAKSALSSSLINCMLYFLEDDTIEKLNFQKQCIRMAYFATTTDHYKYKQQYFHSDIQAKGHSSKPVDQLLISICDDFIINNEEHEIALYAHEVIYKIENLKEEYLNKKIEWESKDIDDE